MKYFKYSQFTDIEALRKLKRERGITIGIGLPVCNEAKTLKKTIKIIQSCGSLVDQIIVFDSGSTDKSERICKKMGVRFIADTQVSRDLDIPLSRGKGWNLWASLYYLNTDLAFWVDSDIDNFHLRFITGLAGPFLNDPELKFIKAYYHRPKNDARVTEILARPFIGILFPELKGFIQPLSGEYGGERKFLKTLTFYSGYSVEMAVLIQATQALNQNEIAQAFLGSRVHKLQSVSSLGKMSASILRTLLDLAVQMGRIGKRSDFLNMLHQFVSKDGANFEMVEYNIKDTKLDPIKSRIIHEKENSTNIS